MTRNGEPVIPLMVVVSGRSAIGWLRSTMAEDNLSQAELVKWHRQAVRALVEAIERHRRSLDPDIDPEPADEELWKVLDTVTVPSGRGQRPVSARRMADTRWRLGARQSAVAGSAAGACPDAPASLWRADGL